MPISCFTLRCGFFTSPSGPKMGRAGGRLSKQCHRQSARAHDFFVPPDFRRHARWVPRPENLRIPRRRLFALLRWAVRLRLRPVSRCVRRRQKTRLGILAAIVFRFDHLHSRRYASSCGRVWREPDHARHRLSISLEHHHRRSKYSRRPDSATLIAARSWEKPPPAC